MSSDKKQKIKISAFIYAVLLNRVLQPTKLKANVTQVGHLRK
jgi:hypothetical protein